MERQSIEFRWRDMTFECEMPEGYILEIEYFEGAYHWTLKHRGKAVEEGRASILTNAKKAAQIAYLRLVA